MAVMESFAEREEGKRRKTNKIMYAVSVLLYIILFILLILYSTIYDITRVKEWEEETKTRKTREETKMGQIRVKSRRDSEHRIIAASGVYGGVTPHGMIYFDVVLEKPEAPVLTTINLNESTGERIETVEEPREPAMERIL